MARLTRHELKQDEFKTTVEEFEHFARENYKAIIAVTAAILVIGGAVVAYRQYNLRQQAQANVVLGEALTTFHAPVGAQSPDAFNPTTPDATFTNAQDKYKKALGQFLDVVQKYPRQNAAQIARYHAGMCQAQLGDDANAVKTLQESAKSSDRDVAALAQVALGGELVRTGKLADGVKIYQQLADHPTSTVPRATALLAMADAYRATQPAQARAVYEKMAKEFSADPYLASTVQQQMTSLPH